ncbi:DNA internalization-related competence protein ComEC/Rec2 [candidate division KSB1 bacterium]|nr:DNA internalization-related competence protein ComEC/Rec2 [candidate division KSB1 bacterium]
MHYIIKRPAVKILLLFIAGLLPGYYVEIPILPLVITFCFLCMLSVVFFKYGNTLPLVTQILFCLTVLLAGATYFEGRSHPQDKSHILNCRDALPEKAEFSGIVCEAPVQSGEKHSIIIQLKSIRLDEKAYKLSGRIIVYLQKITTKISYGDSIRFRGRLQFPRGERNPGGFDYRKYLHAAGIHAIVYVRENENLEVVNGGHVNWVFARVVYPVKSYISDIIDTFGNPKAADFLKGFILGERQHLDDSIIDALSKTGVSHILAVSGLHVGFILLIFWAIFNLLRLPRVLISIFVIIALILYAGVTDLKPPVVRATIMACIFIISPLVQKKSDHLNTLAFAALSILIFNPAELFEPGFQLSFMAVFSILYFYPIFIDRINSVRCFARIYALPILKGIINLLLLSVSVQIGTLPLTMYYFGIFPTYAIFLNIIIIPLVGIILALAAATFIFHNIHGALAERYQVVASFMVNRLLEFIEWIESMPGAWFRVPQPEVWLLITGYIVIFTLVRLNFRQVIRFGIIISLAVLNFILWRSVLETTSPLEVIYFDVGQGDAALVSFPSGKRLLIDTGPTNEQFDTGERIIGSYLTRQGIDRIEYLAISHEHADHLGGAIYLLRHFQIGEVFDYGFGAEPELCRLYQHIIDSLKIPRNVIHAGNCLRISPKCDILIFHPSGEYLNRENNAKDSENNNSLVMRILYGQTSFLFTGDIEAEAESYLKSFGQLLKSEVLKVPHHGSASSSTIEFLRCVSPEYAIVSAGEFNRFDHPSPSTLERYRRWNIQVIQTSRNGAVIFESNGKQIKRIR